MKTTSLTGLVLIPLFLIFLSTTSINAQFVPGSGGTLPDFQHFNAPQGKFGGLLIAKTHRENNVFSGGTRAVMDLEFPAPSTIGATSYTLQYFDSDQTWKNYIYNEQVLTTTGNNFSLNIYSTYKYRLIANGGEKNGFTSNEVMCPVSMINSWFGGWSLDESMFHTGIMIPYLGRGLMASVTVKKLPDYAVINGGLTYQWYRVNPASFEMTAIPNADSVFFVTKEQDLGYFLLMRATGDDVNVGGFLQIMSSSPTIAPNKAFVSDVSLSGFQLNLFKSVNLLTVSDLMLADKNFNDVPITSVTKGSNNAIYSVTAALNNSNSPYRIMNKSDFWSLVTVMEQGPHQMTMPGVEIHLLSSNPEIYGDEVSIIQSQNYVHVKSSILIHDLSVFNISGQLMHNIQVNATETNLNLSKGVYFIRINTLNNTNLRKIFVN
jgi:hypothetical protein